MKKVIVLITAVIGGIIVFNANVKTGHTNPSGAPAAAAGAPADGGLSSGTCARGGCHSGTATEQAGMITSDIPVSGYVPGQTYTVTASVTAANKVRFGFQVSPQTNAGALQGQLVVTNATETKLVGTKYITHKTAGNGGTGSRSWSFNWIAPTAGTGQVTFYGALMAANNNGGDSGDDVYRSTLTVDEAIGNAVGEVNKKPEISLFPNPSNGNFVIGANGFNGDVTVTIFSIDGKLIYTVSENIENNKLNFNLKDKLQAGMYVAVVKAGSAEKTLKFIVE